VCLGDTKIAPAPGAQKNERTVDILTAHLSSHLRVNDRPAKTSICADDSCRFWW
jgi:hypothetical protein